MSATSTGRGRATALLAARAKDSQEKRRRALAAVAALEAAGCQITFAAVAKAAQVSSWLVYADGVRECVEDARRRQADLGVAEPGSASRSARQPATPAGLRADLALAREEIRRLRAERERLLQRLRVTLGTEIAGRDRAELSARIADLDSINRQLVFERESCSAQAEVAQRRVRELEDDLAAARESLRRVIRDNNRSERAVIAVVEQRSPESK
jgi:chromosome segregation ATPase